MKNAEHYRRYLGRLLWLLLIFISVATAVAKPGEIIMGKKEQTFPLLETKTGTYTNVTVTKQTKDWVFILHSQGVCNIKATDLSTDARIALGYEEAPKVAGSPEAVAAASAQANASKLPHVDMSEMKKFAADWRQNRKERETQIKEFLKSNLPMVYSIIGILVAFNFIRSGIFWLVCRKAHTSPGPLIWVPFLKLIPLLRAANMSRVWFFAFFIPVINIIAIVMFSIKIVKSRGKGFWVSILLMLPPTSGIGMLYLAFSSSAPVQMESNELLSLETA